MAIRCLRGGAAALTEGGARAQHQFSQWGVVERVVLKHGGGVAVGSWIYLKDNFDEENVFCNLFNFILLDFFWL